MELDGIWPSDGLLCLVGRLGGWGGLEKRIFSRYTCLPPHVVFGCWMGLDGRWLSDCLLCLVGGLGRWGWLRKENILSIHLCSPRLCLEG